MADILMVYGTSYGQTEKIVKRMAERLTELGHRLSVWRGDALPTEQRLEDFDAVVVGGSVYFGRHQRHLEEFVRDHLAPLNGMPSAFVSVCGALAAGWPHGPREARKYVQRFLARTGWRPEFTRSFAGAVTYTQYGRLIRWVMQRISRRTGRPTDTSRDWDFTDWRAVDDFAEKLHGFLKALYPAAVPTAAAAVGESR
jgi:menaquinone-dependent protoporphyrinogen oxidase